MSFTLAEEQKKVEQIVDSVFQVLVDGSKQDYIGEKISQLEHSLQAAASAQNANADEETILAALLHDIGQFSTSASQKQMFCEADDIMALDPTALINTNNQDKKKIISVGVTGHERIGAEYLRRLGFSQKVTQLVESHVPVKRYLTGKYADYYDSLSAASKLSLKYQGGPYTQEQVAEYEKDPLFQLKIQVRQWDDAAKVVDLQVPSLESYRSMAIRHLLTQQEQQNC